jgi:hypothetical protein
MNSTKPKLGPAAIGVIIALSVAGTGAVILFGWQTWEFVNWLLPTDSLLMKILAVVNFDVFSYIWLATGLFLGRHIEKVSKDMTFIAGIVTLLLSLACSVIQMTIQRDERFLTNIDPNQVDLAYGMIIIALIWNIITILILLHVEWPFISGEKQRERFVEATKPGLPLPVQQPTIPLEQLTTLIREIQNQNRPALPAPSAPSSVHIKPMASLPQAPAPAPAPKPTEPVTQPLQPNVVDALKTGNISPDRMKKLLEMAVRYGQLTEEEIQPVIAALNPGPGATNPLAQPQLNTQQANQAGMTNGNGNH